MSSIANFKIRRFYKYNSETTQAFEPTEQNLPKGLELDSLVDIKSQLESTLELEYTAVTKGVEQIIPDKADRAKSETRHQGLSVMRAFRGAKKIAGKVLEHISKPENRARMLKIAATAGLIVGGTAIVASGAGALGLGVAGLSAGKLVVGGTSATMMAAVANAAGFKATMMTLGALGASIGSVSLVQDIASNRQKIDKVARETIKGSSQVLDDNVWKIGQTTIQTLDRSVNPEILEKPLAPETVRNAVKVDTEPTDANSNIDNSRSRVNTEQQPSQAMPALLGSLSTVLESNTNYLQQLKEHGNLFLDLARSMETDPTKNSIRYTLEETARILSSSDERYSANYVISQLAQYNSKLIKSSDHPLTELLASLASKIKSEIPAKSSSNDIFSELLQKNDQGPKADQTPTDPELNQQSDQAPTKPTLEQNTSNLTSMTAVEVAADNQAKRNGLRPDAIEKEQERNHLINLTSGLGSALDQLKPDLPDQLQSMDNFELYQTITAYGQVNADIPAESSIGQLISAALESPTKIKPGVHDGGFVVRDDDVELFNTGLKTQKVLQNIKDINSQSKTRAEDYIHTDPFNKGSEYQRKYAYREVLGELASGQDIIKNELLVQVERKLTEWEGSQKASQIMGEVKTGKSLDELDSTHVEQAGEALYQVLQVLGV